MERLAELNYGEYLREIARADIAIAPLLDGGMNHQSRATSSFWRPPWWGAGGGLTDGVRRTIVDGVTGLTARSPREWRDQLERLTADPGLWK